MRKKASSWKVFGGGWTQTPWSHLEPAVIRGRLVFVSPLVSCFRCLPRLRCFCRLGPLRLCHLRLLRLLRLRRFRLRLCLRRLCLLLVLVCLRLRLLLRLCLQPAV